MTAKNVTSKKVRALTAAKTLRTAFRPRAPMPQAQRGAGLPTGFGQTAAASPKPPVPAAGIRNTDLSRGRIKRRVLGY